MEISKQSGLSCDEYSYLSQVSNKKSTLGIAVTIVT